jgi:hypothetical protein
VIPNFDQHQPYDDRRHGGNVLATRLGHFKGRQNLVVLALPRAAFRWCMRWRACSCRRVARLLRRSGDLLKHIDEVGRRSEAFRHAP